MKFHSLGQEDPLEKEMATHPVFLPGEFHGQRSLAGYSPWVAKSWAQLRQLRMSMNRKTGIYESNMPLGKRSVKLKLKNLFKFLGEDLRRKKKKKLNCIFRGGVWWVIQGTTFLWTLTSFLPSSWSSLCLPWHVVFCCHSFRSVSHQTCRLLRTLNLYPWISCWLHSFPCL